MTLAQSYVGEGVDIGGLGVFGDGAETGEGVGSVDVHGAGAADSLATGSTEGERWVNLIFDLHQSIEH